MSYAKDLWSGKEDILDEVSFEYEEEFDPFLYSVYSDMVPPLRWNINTKASRERKCWVCGIKTSDFYQHKWRVPEGKIANIKCTCCYNKYIENKNNKEDKYEEDVCFV
tara:strand:+ start:521 stop:844 length:324 start_codon:yes stop_codon:yes gene_type:complete